MPILIKFSTLVMEKYDKIRLCRRGFELDQTDDLNIKTGEE